MNYIFSYPSSVKLPQANRDAKNEEYGRELGGVGQCRNCGGAHFRKAWYGSLRDVAKIYGRRPTHIREQRCPACTMIMEHEFEGELVVENIPPEHKKKVRNIIKNFGRRAEQMDHQHRIIAIEDRGNNFRITTTQNQLADRIAKKLREVLHQVQLHISYSREPYEVDRVRLTFTAP